MRGRWVPALAVSATIALAGYRAGALTGRAAAAATLVGASVLGGSGWRGGSVLASFFTSGSALPRMFPGGKRFKSDRARNERQVLANGGVAALAGALAPVIGDKRTLVAIAGSLAAATADTWATEIGSTSSQVPRLILSRQPVTPGLSGGVTARGNLSAVAGAMSVAALAGLITKEREIAIVVALAGLVGTTVDSLLGELLQARYRDSETGGITEDVGGNDQPRQLVAGKCWVDNDAVNLACTLSGGLTALIAREGFRRR